MLLIFLSKRCQNFRPIGRLNASAEALKGQIEPFVLLDDFPTFWQSQKAGWWVEEDLNLRPHAYQACALTT